MKKLSKLMGGVVVTGAITVASISSALAGTSITRVSSTDLNGSYVNTILSQSDSTIKARGGNVKITDLTSKRINGSVIDTGVFTGSSTIDVKGRNTDVLSADTLEVNGSLAGTLINDVKSQIKTRSR